MTAKKIKTTTKRKFIEEMVDAGHSDADIHDAIDVSKSYVTQIRKSHEKHNSLVTIIIIILAILILVIMALYNGN